MASQTSQMLVIGVASRTQIEERFGGIVKLLLPANHSIAGKPGFGLF